jgi:ribosome-associated heat shock protein Hsp15
VSGQRIDVWLHRARFAKTRAAAARLVAEGGIRLTRQGLSRRVEKPSVELEAGDALLLTLNGRMLAVRVLALPKRRGPTAESRAAFSELDAEALA